MKTASPHLAFVKAFSFTLKQFRLYSENHPITQQALKALELELEKYFSVKSKITLGAMQRMLVIDGNVVTEKDPASLDLAKDFERLGIEGLTLERGLTLPEASAFLNFMAMRNKGLEARGGFKKIMESHPYPHIRLASGKYELVEEGQKVTDAAATSPTGAAPSSAAGSFFSLRQTPGLLRFLITPFQVPWIIFQALW